MRPDEPGTDFAAAYAWQATLVLGVVTLILGLIVTIYPHATLNVIAVLLGLLLIVSGIFHLSGCSGATRRTGCGWVSPACSWW